MAFSNHLQMVLMSKPWDRSKVLLSLEQEVERQTTGEQIAENEGHEQFKESQRIEPAAKVQRGIGDFKELKKYNFLVMTLITTVTFAAAFQVPGGYDGHGKANLVNGSDFRKFLIYDSLSFGTSAFSLLIYFATPIIQKMTSVQDIVPQVTALLSTISLAFMILAFSAGVQAVLEEKSSLYSLINFTIAYSVTIPANLLYLLILIVTCACISRGLVVLAREFVLSFLPHRQMIPFRQLFRNPCALAGSLFFIGSVSL